MAGKNNKSKEGRMFHPTQSDVNSAREKQVVLDPEKGPENKARKQ